MASVKLKLKTTQLLKDGSHPIILQLLKDGKKSISSLGLSCDIDEWNIKTNLPKNRRLSIICQKKLIELEELLFEGIDKDWSAKKIINIFTGKDKKRTSLFDYYNTIQIDKETGISTGLVDKTKLNKFKTFLKNKDIYFDDIDFQLLKDYKFYLKEQNLKTGTRYLSFLRTIYNHAIDNEVFFPKKNPFKSSLFDKKITTNTLQRNLNIDETKRVFELDYSLSWSKSYKSISLDFWKFCFLMRGINLIELALIKKDDVKNDYHVFTREKLSHKTTSTQKIKILPEARAIIDRYINQSNSKYVFPLLDNDFDKKNLISYKRYKNKISVVNSNLRSIGKEIGVNFNFTTMSARYTFINLAKSNGVPFLYLQELIGHKTQSTTDIYMDIFNQKDIDKYHREVIDLIV